MHTLVLRPPFDRSWSERDPFQAASELARSASQADIRRDVEGRRTLRFEHEGRAYYLKAQAGIGWGRILEEWLHLRRPVLGASHEWNAIQACEAAGVPTMTAVAFGERGQTWAHRESFLVTEAIEPAIDLDSYTRAWSSHPPPPAWKWALIHEVALIAGALHRNGLNHRDFYLCHFLLRQPAPEPSARPSLALIDLHRMQIRNQTPLRWRDKDLAALAFSSARIGLTLRDRLRFLRTYFDRPLRETLRQEAASLHYLQRESVRLIARFDRKFAHRPDQQR